MLLLECLLDLIRFLLGAALFSFMNVVAWRLPRGMDPLQGRSHCPQCGHTLGAGGAATAVPASRCGIFWLRCWAACWRWAAPGASALRSA